MKRKTITALLLIALMISVSACSSKTDNTSFTLNEGESVSGPLFIFTTNATLEEGSSVDGSVVMLCCNLRVHGNVTGTVFLMTGNLEVGRNADIGGDIRIISGHVSK